MPTRPISLAVLGLLAASATARAQSFDPAWLDRQAELRNAARGAQPPAAPEPPAPPGQRQAYHRPPGLAVCMSVPSWTPIHAAPSPSSPVLAYTTDTVAVTSQTDRAYTRVMLPDGSGDGFVPKHAVSPYRNAIRPSATCTVMLDAANRPRFGIK